MILHVVNKSPYEKNSLESCLRLSRAGSSILLIEDGVYAGVGGSSAARALTEAMADRKTYALGPDLKARGIAPDRLVDGIEIVDYAGFVKLAADNEKVQSWL